MLHEEENDELYGRRTKTSDREELVEELDQQITRVAFSPEVDIRKYHRKRSIGRRREDEQRIPSYQHFAYIALLCFFPTGIAAVVRSCQVKIALRANDYNEAEDMSDSARMFTIISIIFGVVLLCMGSAYFLGIAANV